MTGGQPTEKRCRDCEATKPLDEFPLQKLGRLGRHPLCKRCRAAQERARYWRQREQILERARLDPARHVRVRWRALQRKYGLDREGFDRMRADQAGCCAICERSGEALVVDHDHRTGAVRGLLCTCCNLAVGEFDDDPARCDAAASYLAARS